MSVLASNTDILYGQDLQVDFFNYSFSICL